MVSNLQGSSWGPCEEVMTMGCQTVGRYPVPSCAQTPVWLCVDDQVVSVWLGRALGVQWCGYGELQCVTLAGGNTWFGYCCKFSQYGVILSSTVQ